MCINFGPKKNSSDFLEFLLTNITQLSLLMCLLFPVQMDRAPVLILGFSFPLTEKNSEKHNQKESNPQASFFLKGASAGTPASQENSFAP